MVLDKDVAVAMRDGALLRANVFRSDEGGRFPVLMTLGPYGKDVGFRLALTIQGKDFERPGEAGAQKGSGWFLHDDPRDRPPETFAGTHTVYSGADGDRICCCRQS